MNIAERLHKVVERLLHKIDMSQTPVPGFILGLSGTDSIVAFHVLHEGLAARGMAHRLRGIHHADPTRRPSAFARDALPWLMERYPQARIETLEPLGGNHDPQRWADLQLRAVHDVRTAPDGRVTVTALETEETYWVSGTINATEHALGKHSVAANAVSIQPIRSLWKTDVMEACELLGAPRSVIEAARHPDCLCGRDEIAAEHIEVIDLILRHAIDVRDHDPELVVTLTQWISDMKRGGGFRGRIPYIV